MSTGEKRYTQESDPRLRGAEHGFSPEFAEELPLGDRPQDVSQFSRRGFLAALGLSAAAFSSACSRSPVGHVLPFNDPPEELIAGVPLFYASSCGGCPARCGVLVKTRDGRPIKLEGNDKHPLTRGGLCAVGQASVLSLYDASRARGPQIAGKDASWAEVDQAVKSGLGAAGSKPVYVVTAGDLGPSEEAIIARFEKAHAATKRIVYDSSGAQLIAAAHEVTHGARAVPAFHIDKAALVLGIEADFLGTWLSPVAFTKQYSAARDPKAEKMLRHYHIEPRLTVTGSVADARLTAAPSDTVPILAALAKALGGGMPELAKIAAPKLSAEKLARFVQALKEAKGKAVVLCGSFDPAAQVLTNVVNHLLGAYTEILSLAEAEPYPAGAMTFEAWLDALNKEGAAAVLLWNVNPAHSHPRGAELKDLLSKVPLTVCTNDRRDETGALVKILAPDHNPLESWGDVRPIAGVVGLRQPAVSPLFDTRSAALSLLRWAGETMSEDDHLRTRWESEVFPRAKGAPDTFVSFWDKALQDGYVEMGPKEAPAASAQASPVPTGTAPAEPPGPAPTAPTAAPAPGAEAPAAAADVAPSGPPEAPAPPAPPTFDFRPDAAGAALSKVVAAPSTGLELWLYEKVGIRDGRLANNAWLLELPDPITKVTWTNYAVISAALATEKGLVEGDMATITAMGKTVTLPVLVEPGVHPKVVAVAVGYGRSAAGKVGDGIGVDVFPLGKGPAGEARKDVGGAALERAQGHKDLAKSQTHASQEGREIVRETTLAALKKHPAGGGEDKGHGKRHLSMWPGHAYPGAKWEMVVDLTACTGCSACVIACQAENNIPSVGELEVFRRREMHWIRLDRYYAGDADEPTVVHQPMMCQHCENAPCETVCPVLATVHSSEGLNQQVYNRCVGTRYCANNCPPKVRRFNWFDYPHDDMLARMVLNPEVAVRSRGIMEKCSFCVQRIQEAKATAKAEGRAVKDGDFQTACEQTCPAGAIVFGNINDPESRVSKLTQDPRRYRVLEELNTGPAVAYLTRVRALESPASGHPDRTEKHHG